MNIPPICGQLAALEGCKIRLDYFDPGKGKAQNVTGIVHQITEDDPVKVVINDGTSAWEIPAAYIKGFEDLSVKKEPEIVKAPAPEPQPEHGGDHDSGPAIPPHDHLPDSGPAKKPPTASKKP